MATETSKERERQVDFSLLGGPLHRLGCRVGLVRGGTNTVALGLVLGVLPWTILVLLAVIGGVSGQIFSLSVIGGHVRLLLVIPLFFLCESLLDPRAKAFVRVIVHSEVVPDAEVPRLNAEIARIARWKDSWLPEALCLLAAVLMSVDAPQLSLPGTTAVYDPSKAGAAALWYWLVCLPMFRFLAFRWIWRLLLWWYFLWRVSRLKLNLIPTHPDGVAGLGYLEVVHAEFATLIFAISAAAAAAFAEGLVAGSLSFTALYPAVALIVVIDAAMFLGPLCIFTPKLWLSRVTGLDTYMDFASRYVIAFDKKWLGKGSAHREDLLGTNDLQSLADLTKSLRVVTEMRLVPASHRLALIVAAAALLPILPLLLLQYPVAELADKLFKMVFSF
jgi:hypothetical protein